MQDKFPKALIREGDPPAAQTKHCRSGFIFISWSHGSQGSPTPLDMLEVDKM